MTPCQQRQSLMNNKLSVKTVDGDEDGVSDEAEGKKKEKSKNHECLDDLT